MEKKRAELKYVTYILIATHVLVKTTCSAYT